MNNFISFQEKKKKRLKFQEIISGQRQILDVVPSLSLSHIILLFLNGDSREIAEQSPNINQVAPCPQLLHVGPELGKAKQHGQFTPDENLASTSCQHWKSSRELQVESWPLPQILFLL